MLCLKCGNEIKDNEQICSKCGYNKNTISNTDNPFGVKNQGIYNPNAVDKEKAQEKLDRGILVYILNLLIYFFASATHMKLYLYGIIALIVQIFLGVTFKRFYFNECVERVAKIKQENTDKGFNQLTEIVRLKGGTNPTAVIIALLPALVLIILFLLIFFPFILQF